MLRNSAQHFPHSLTYHYSSIDVQKKHQFPWTFSRIHIKSFMLNFFNEKILPKNIFS